MKTIQEEIEKAAKDKLEKFLRNKENLIDNTTINDLKEVLSKVSGQGDEMLGKAIDRGFWIGNELVRRATRRILPRWIQNEVDLFMSDVAVMRKENDDLKAQIRNLKEHNGESTDF